LILPRQWWTSDLTGSNDSPALQQHGRKQGEIFTAATTPTDAGFVDADHGDWNTELRFVWNSTRVHGTVDEFDQETVIDAFRVRGGGANRERNPNFFFNRISYHVVIPLVISK
jgi:hypothetical protein